MKVGRPLEPKMINAIADYRAGKFKTVYACAKHHGVQRSSMMRQIKRQNAPKLTCAHCGHEIKK